jgi:hypothetical protein
VFTDQDSAANGVVCQFSPDNLNWDDRVINDKDADGIVSRVEYLVNRRKAYDKADRNHDGRLDFEEFAAATAKKFVVADRNADGRLTPREFATTAVKRKAKPACVCPVPEE